MDDISPAMSVTCTALVERWAAPRFAVVEATFATPAGAVTRPVIHHPGAVAILAQPTPHQVVLVQQYRYALRQWTWEIPAGTRQPDEDPRVTAGRELQEEAGFQAERLVELIRFHPAPGISDELLIVYRASGLTPVAVSPDHGELIRPAVVACADLPQRLRESPGDAKTLLALWLGGLLHPSDVAAIEQLRPQSPVPVRS
jgi:ADP-ribose pyrophosphatase